MWVVPHPSSHHSPPPAVSAGVLIMVRSRAVCPPHARGRHAVLSADISDDMSDLPRISVASINPALSRTDHAPSTFHSIEYRQPGTERVQALADISRSALCCHSNETRAPIANPPNSAQLDGTPYHSLKLHPGPCSSVGMRRGTERQIHRQRDRQTHRRP